MKEENGVELLKMISESERHFNILQSEYRKLSTTLFLGVFASIGYLLSSKIENFFIDLYFLVFWICIIAFIGNTLIWVLDILVYHRLLDASFIEGLKIEEKFPELPQVRHNSLKFSKKRRMRTLMAIFYICSNTILLLCSSCFLFFYLKNYDIVLAVILTIALILLTLFSGIKMYKITENSRKELRD